MPVARHPTRWWNWYMSEDKKTFFFYDFLGLKCLDTPLPRPPAPHPIVYCKSIKISCYVEIISIYFQKKDLLSLNCRSGESKTFFTK